MYTRKATFRLRIKDGKKFYVAVNKRAKYVCRRAGKRSILSHAVLKSYVGAGSYEFYYYNSNGLLKPIKF